MNQTMNRFEITLATIFLVFTYHTAWSQHNNEPQMPIMVVGSGGTKIAVYEYGDPTGPEVLLVHGFTGSHLAWAKQYKSPMLQKFRIVAMDLRGHGAT